MASARPLVLAHRGASAQAPENTLAAFVLAGELGADGVELDVHRTSDGALVVHHDADLPGLGVVSEVSFAAVRAAHPSVPTLDEVLDVCTGMRLVNIELKCCAWDLDADPERVLARGVAALIAERDLYDSVVVSSFDLTQIDDLRAIDDRIDTAWLVHGVDPAGVVDLAAERGHRWLHPDWGNLDANLDAVCAAAHAAGLRLDTWTCDDPEVARRFAAAGVDALITNVPDIILAALS